MALYKTFIIVIINCFFKFCTEFFIINIFKISIQLSWVEKSCNSVHCEGYKILDNDQSNRVFYNTSVYWD